MVGFAKKPYVFILSYDASDGKDEAVLTVGRRNENGVMTIDNVYHGKTAERMYHILKIAGMSHYGI